MSVMSAMKIDAIGSARCHKRDQGGGRAARVYSPQLKKQLKNYILFINSQNSNYLTRIWNLKEIHRYCCLYREQALL
jgi:hypothetical protein